MQTGSNADTGQLGNRGTEGLSDFLKVKHIQMHKQRKTEELTTITATAQIPARHMDSSFPTISYFPKCPSGPCNTRINKGHVMLEKHRAWIWKILNRTDIYWTGFWKYANVPEELFQVCFSWGRRGEHKFKFLLQAADLFEKLVIL